MKYLPIRRISFSTPQPRRNELLAEAKGLYAGFLDSRDPAAIIKFVADRLSAKPEESDVVHDLLSFLAERMIEMNKAKHEALRAFETDLEGALGDKAGKLSRLYTPPKRPNPDKFKDDAKFRTKQAEYEEALKEAETLLGKDLIRKRIELDGFPVLSDEQLKELVKRKLGKMSNLSQILKVFKRYSEEVEVDGVKGLRTLYSRIDKPYERSTDWLIDRIVYALYGLTDDEIRVVEEGLGNGSADDDEEPVAEAE